MAAVDPARLRSVAASEQAAALDRTAASVRELTVTWPSGATQVLKDVAADQVLTVREPQ